MKVYCDMDGVLVNQTGRVRFDLMGWMPDGRALWAFLAPLKPTILSQLRPDVYEVSKPEKVAWCARELGLDVPVIVVRAEDGKFPHCRAGDILIDDDAHTHGRAWAGAGGMFVHHLSAAQSIERLRGMLKQ